MKREIKFRAWDKTYGWMSAVKGNPINRKIAISFDGKIVDFRKAKFPPPQMRKFILMQFTGLKDKNGKEIYEGDICKITNSWTTFNRQCEFIDSSFGFKGTNGTFFPNAELMEIVGNIYENPELLNE